MHALFFIAPPCSMHRRSIFVLLFSFVASAPLWAQEGFDDFDWEGYTFWEDQTSYSKVLYVDQNHPKASDQNPGTAELPLKTIQAAADQATPGTKVLIAGGRYREGIRPALGGKNAGKMIAYQALQGEEVIVSGSELLGAPWVKDYYYSDMGADSSKHYTWSERVWQCTLSDTAFLSTTPVDVAALELQNIEAEEYAYMSWTKPVVGKFPYHLKRVLLFQDGQRLTQLGSFGDVSRLEGSFWVDKDGKTLHINPLGEADPNQHLFEVALRPFLFKPKVVGIDYIKLKGITFEHCANGFIRSNSGAVNAFGGDHWIIEQCTVRQVNSSGLEFGRRPFEKAAPQLKPSAVNTKGHHLIRNNTIHNCGTAGIRSLGVPYSLIEGNHIYDCAWQDAEHYWECAGIKLLVNDHTLVRRNHIHDIQAGCGIWMDWGNTYSRVTQNLIYNITSIQGGIFMEASSVPNLTDHNLLWNIQGNGIYANDSHNQAFYHNIIGKVSRFAFHSTTVTDRTQGGALVDARENTFKHNLIYDSKPLQVDTSLHFIDENRYLFSETRFLKNYETAQTHGFEQNSSYQFAWMKWLPEVRTLKFSQEIDWLQFPKAAPLKKGLNGQDLPKQVQPGLLQQKKDNGILAWPY